MEDFFNNLGRFFAGAADTVAKGASATGAALATPFTLAQDVGTHLIDPAHSTNTTGSMWDGIGRHHQKIDKNGAEREKAAEKEAKAKAKANEVKVEDMSDFDYAMRNFGTFLGDASNTAWKGVRSIGGAAATPATVFMDLISGLAKFPHSTDFDYTRGLWDGVSRANDSTDSWAESRHKKLEAEDAARANKKAQEENDKMARDYYNANTITDVDDNGDKFNYIASGISPEDGGSRTVTRGNRRTPENELDLDRLIELLYKMSRPRK